MHSFDSHRLAKTGSVDRNGRDDHGARCCKVGQIFPSYLGSVCHSSLWTDTASSSDTDTFFDEMNRRERWDRAFEKASKDLNISIDGFGKDLEKSGLENEPLYEEKRVEHQRRVRWDADHGKKPRPLDESLRRIGLSTTE